MKVIYIAGHYRSDKGEWYVTQNIEAAASAALFVWLYGGVALCPHKNTSLFGGAYGIPDRTWLDGDLELLSRCDAIWALPGWDTSSGAQAEVEFAEDLNMPILYDQPDVLRFLGKEVIEVR